MTREYVKYQGIKFYRHPKYEKYLASRCGQILSLKRKEKKILKLNTNCWGYYHFNLSKNGIKRYSVHRFVFETFNGEVPVDKHVDHADNCKENNSIKNLQLLSPKENIRKSKCKKVISYNLETQEEMTFNSNKEAAEFYQIHKSTVSKNCKKETKITKSKKDGKKFQFFYL